MARLNNQNQDEKYIRWMARRHAAHKKNLLQREKAFVKRKSVTRLVPYFVRQEKYREYNVVSVVLRSRSGSTAVRYSSLSEVLVVTSMVSMAEKAAAATAAAATAFVLSRRR